MSSTKKTLLAYGFALGMLVSGAANATNGMFMIGYGAKATAMGGAGVAYPQDGMAAAYNPALLTEVGESRLDGTAEFFYPPRCIYHDSSTLPANECSKDNYYVIPAVGAVLSSPGTPFAAGFAMVGAGLGTNYAQNPHSVFDPPNIAAYKQVGVFLVQMQMLPSVAYRINEHNSVGATLVIAAQAFRAWGLEGFGTLGFSNSSQGLTNNGLDWSYGYGYRLGWLGTYFDKRLRLGFNYSPQVDMSRFDKYRGLFARHGEFNIPENYTGGLAFKWTRRLDMAFDIERIMWSHVTSIGNAGPLASNPNNFYPLCPPGSNTTQCDTGGELGMGFGWTDQTVYKLGFAYRYTPQLTLRAGLNYGKSPIPSDQVLFNMLAPATVEKHVTFGATYAPRGSNSDFTVTFMHAFKNTIKGPTAFPPASTGGAPVSGSNAAISMSETSLSFGYGLRF